MLKEPNRVAPWAGKLTDLLRRYKGGDDSGFRNAFKDILEPYRGSIDDSVYRELLAIRPQFERWSNAPAAADALLEWLEAYRSLRDRVATGVLQALLPRKRKRNAAIPIERLLQEEDDELLRFVLKSHLLDSKAYASYAAASPEVLYNSQLIDHATQHGFPPSKTVCELIRKRIPRAQGLPNPLELLVAWYSAKRKPDAAKLLLSIAVGDRPAAEVLLNGILIDRQAALTLARFTAFDWVYVDKKKTSERVALAEYWLHICREMVANGSESSNPTGVAALLSLGLLLGTHSNVVSGLDGDISKLLATALRLTEQDPDSGQTFIVAANGAHLHAAIHQFLQSARTMDYDNVSGPRELYQQHLGRKTIALEVIDALDSADGAELRDAVNAGLFNAGVRPIGEPGESLSFDPHLHTVVLGTPVTSEIVVVIEPGRALGSGSHQIVLKKARVSGVEQGSVT